MSSVIIGAKKMHQPEDKLKAVDVSLSDEQRERLNAVTRPEALYPEWMVERQNSNR